MAKAIYSERYAAIKVTRDYSRLIGSQPQTFVRLVPKDRGPSNSASTCRRLARFGINAGSSLPSRLGSIWNSTANGCAFQPTYIATDQVHPPRRLISPWAKPRIRWYKGEFAWFSVDHRGWIIRSEFSPTSSFSLISLFNQKYSRFLCIRTIYNGTPTYTGRIMWVEILPQNRLREIIQWESFRCYKTWINLRDRERWRETAKWESASCRKNMNASRCILRL